MRGCNSKYRLLLFGFLTFSTTLTTNASSDCSDFAYRTNDCWIKHEEVPPCGKGTYPLTACITNVVDRFPSDCPMKDRTIAQRILGISTKLHDKVCMSEEVEKDFLENPRCWQSVRTCLVNLPISFEEVSYRYTPPLFDLEEEKNIPIKKREEAVAAQCYKEGAALKYCQSTAIGCDLERFLDSILDDSICKEFRIEDCPDCALKYAPMDQIVQRSRHESNSGRTVKNISLPEIVLLAFLYSFFFNICCL